jgi:hypothetical protein
MIVYSSTDASAPVITNTNGSLIALLYACLVTGYGSKPGAGWSRPYTGTNLAVFQQGAGGNGRYLRVFDGGTQGDAQGRAVKLRAYNAMTAVSTGTNPFPTTGQKSGNGMNYLYRHSSHPGTPIWTVYASSSWFWIITSTYYDGSTPNYHWSMMGFGTFNSEKAGDTFNQALIASNSDDGGWPGYTNIPMAASSMYDKGIFVERSDTGAGGSQFGDLVSYGTTGWLGTGNSTTFPYPNRVKSALLQEKPQLWCDNYHRGYLPGLWASLHIPADLGGDGTTWSGTTGLLAGKSFRLYGALDPFYTGGAYPIIETSNTW